jgi:hypothetical protein
MLAMAINPDINNYGINPVIIVHRNPDFVKLSIGSMESVRV